MNDYASVIYHPCPECEALVPINSLMVTFSSTQMWGGVHMPGEVDGVDVLFGCDCGCGWADRYGFVRQ